MAEQLSALAMAMRVPIVSSCVLTLENMRGNERRDRELPECKGHILIEDVIVCYNAFLAVWKSVIAMMN
jgi:hypothetical protein